MTTKKQGAKRTKNMPELVKTVVGAGDITLVPLDNLRANPYQPRLTPDLARRAELKASILEHGLGQYPVGRRSGEYIEIGDGWERATCYRELRDDSAADDDEFNYLPVVVRDLTDQQMADLAVESNEKRQALNPIDLAKFFKRYLESFPITQQDLAARFGMSQPALSNTMRLLDLPDSVQDKVISQEITPAHARVLLQIKDSPETQERLANETVEEKASVRRLAQNVSRALQQVCRPLDGYYHPHGHAEFDTEACQGCVAIVVPADIELEDVPALRDKENRFCSNVSCWEAKQKVGLAAKKDKEQKKLAKQLGQKGVLDMSKLEFNSYTQISDADKALCSDVSCEHSRHGKYDNRAMDLRLICTNPKCMNKKRAAAGKAETQRKREDFDKNLATIRQLLEAPRRQPEFADGMCQPLLAAMIRAFWGQEEQKYLAGIWKVKPEKAWQLEDELVPMLDRQPAWELFWILADLALHRGFGPDQKYYRAKDPKEMLPLIDRMKEPEKVESLE